MPRLTVRSFVFAALALFVMSAVAARAEEQPIPSSDFHVTTSDGVSIIIITT